MINKVILMGRMTADAELKTTQSNKTVTVFTVAVDRRLKQDTTDFIRCVAWEHNADFINRYFHKGNMIALVGEIQTRKYDDNGESRTITEVLVSEVSFCGDKKEEKKQDDIPEEFPFD